MAEHKGKDLMDKGPGDLKEEPRVPTWRGEDGKGGDPNSSKEDTASVEYDR